MNRTHDSVRTEVLTSPDEIRALRDAWSDLVAESPAAEIFHVPDWIEAWLEVARDVSPLVLAAHDSDGRLIGVAPFDRVRLKLLRTVTYRCLRFLGDRSTGGEYPDLILRQGCEEAALDALARRLARERGWDCLWLPLVAGWSGAEGRWERFCRTGGFVSQRRPADFASIQLPDTYADYFQRLSSNARTHIRRDEKKLATMGRIEIVRCQRVDEIPELLDALFDLHRRRWQELGHDGCFHGDSAMIDFYRAFAPVAQQRGWLRLFALKLNGEIKAVQYGYLRSGVFYSVQEGFDPELPGAGKLLRARAIESFVEERVRTYDFLGGYSDHKRRWGAEQRMGSDWLIGRRSVKNRLIFTRPLWPTGRYLRPA